MDSGIKGFFLGAGLGMGISLLVSYPSAPESHGEAPILGAPPNSVVLGEAEPLRTVLIRDRINKQDPPRALSDEEEMIAEERSALEKRLAASEAKVERLKKKKTELTSQVIAAKWQYRKALEDPMSTPYGSFLGSSVGWQAGETDLTNIWYLLNDLPVVLSEVEAVWLLDQVQNQNGGVVPIEAMVRFLGAERIVKEVSAVQLEDVRQFFDDEEWERMFPPYLLNESD